MSHSCPIALAETQESDKPHFEENILPILKTHCHRCHSGNRPKGRLLLTSRAQLIKGGRSGPSIRLGAAESSLLWEKIAADRMPPDGPRLNADQKGMIRSWINEGGLGADPSLPDNSSYRDPETTREQQLFWAFNPPIRPAPPEVKKTQLVRNSIDHFILSKLEQQKLTFSPEADPLTLLRRAHFDLTGLPPSPEVIAAFLSQPFEQSYPRLIDRLLASPHYGERWGRHWLDVAGYADSAGVLSEDRPLPLAWKYRDYVIRSFNEDKPYDQFLQEQIAGDELTDYWDAFENKKQLPTTVVDGVIATGFLRCAADSSRPDFSTIKNASSLYFYPTLNDTFHIVSSSVMGLTIQCARCHDHKFDPISQKDYYRIQAVFMGAYRPTDWIPQMERRIVTATQFQQKQAEQHNKPLQEQLKVLQKESEELTEKFQTTFFDDEIGKLPSPIRKDVRDALLKNKEKRSAIDAYLVSKFQSRIQPEKAQLHKSLIERYPDYRDVYRDNEKQLQNLRTRLIHFEEIRALYDLPGSVPTPFLMRGDPLTPAEPVSPGVVSILERVVPFYWNPPANNSRTSGRRLAFAQWLTHPKHPLTARVLVNRVWMHHFGVGLVATTENFGQMGSRPSHEKLLDWLACEFVSNGWSIKHLHKLIMMSHSYRQQSDISATLLQTAQPIDPDNRLLWRQRMRRLEAEPFRDSLLHVTGQLDSHLFGPPIRVQRLRDGEVTLLDGKSHRRSIYLQVLRSNPHTLLQVFDQPVMEVNCLQRRTSTVATQALTLLNSPSLIHLSNQFADRLLLNDSTNLVRRAILIAFSREPTKEEERYMSDFLNSQTRQYQQESDSDSTASDNSEKAEHRAVSDLCQMLLCSNEFIFID